MSKDKVEKKDKSEKALAAEKEQFVKLQVNMQSCHTLVPVPSWPFLNFTTDILLGTHWENGAVTFWSHAVSLPLASNAIVSWKFCEMVHKLLRDGHPNTLRDSQGHVPNMKQMGTLWGSLHDRYGHIVALYVKFLCLKIEFHCKHKMIPPNLDAPDEVLDRAIPVDINEVYVFKSVPESIFPHQKKKTNHELSFVFRFEITNEVQDYMDAALVLQETVFNQLESNNTSPTTTVGQCRLAPLVPLIQDCSPLYYFLVKLLFKLHSPSMIDYVKPVVVHNQFPEDDDLESQVEAGEGHQMFYALNHYDPTNDISVQREKEVKSMRKELEALRPEVKMFKAEAQRAIVHLKDQVNKLEAELEDQRTQKQMAMVENEQLRMEVEALRTQTAVTSLDDSRVQTAQMHFSRLKEKHAELVTRHADLMRKNADMVKQLASSQQIQEELNKTKQQITHDLEQLKHQNNTKLEAQKAEIVQLKQELQTRTAEITNVQSALQSKEKSGDQLSSVLVGLQAEKETLMRSLKEQEAELANLRQAAQLNQNTLQQERDKTQSEMSLLQSQLLEKVSREQEQQMELEKLKRELELKRAEAITAQSALQSKEAAGDQLSSVLVGLQAEKETLMRLLKEQEAELAKLRQAAQLHQTMLQQERDKYQREIDSLKSQLQEKAGHEMNSVMAGLQAQKETMMRSLKEQETELAILRQSAQLHQTALQQEKEKSQREMSLLQNQLQAKLSRESELQQKLQEEQFCLLQCAVVEAEGIILDALAKVDDPMHVRCVCTPEYLINRAETTLVSIGKMQQSHAGYLGNLDDASGLLRSVTQFSHLAADTIVNGAAASHSAPTDQADRLTDNCRDCATHCLQFLKELKLKATLPRADPSAIRYTVQRILNQATDLRRNDVDVQKAELADMVDEEMAATSSAIEEAVLRMDAIHMLVTAATDLQKDIVESGRGSGSVKDFYAKNSCWTEGLISASKAVGWGATQMVDSADKVVTDRGKYEELIVCSHEIAASTAQLVAASKVKADRSNKKLNTLLQASRHVNDMAAVVVTSTKSGQMQIEDKDPMDFSGMSLIKLKTEEMESQVKVLELENQLSNERQRLGELRKKHYELAGVPLDPTVERDFDGMRSKCGDFHWKRNRDEKRDGDGTSIIIVKFSRCNSLCDRYDR
ncbi:Huntingtin-interacting protein 1-related protein [Bagarius yarrelli]|uniref:Huntingtin-interacting protein 1-related protein n=1 Tax=Bagarius yarrelli TaxID=175774 RepID=A0A556U394_BAGYA|nr:Huntingtin-interacting protein 1-related protein [Bagarius yarrelli]